MANRRQWFRLIQPRLQLRMMGMFGALAGLSLLLQLLLVQSSITRLAVELPQDGPLVLERLSSLLFGLLVGSYLVLLPVVFIVGVAATRHWAGPLYRFQSFLEDIERGGKPADLRLRSGDDLAHIGELLNRVTSSLRQPEAGEAQEAALDRDLSESMERGAA